jgi:hypothetical protein
MPAVLLAAMPILEIARNRIEFCQYLSSTLFQIVGYPMQEGISPKQEHKRNYKVLSSY